MKSRNWLLAGLLAAVAAGAAAENRVYRWTDADGRVHYSDHVPPGTRQAQRVSVPEGDPSGLAQMLIGRDGDTRIVRVRNLLAGPIEVRLGTSADGELLSEPVLPLGEVLPGGQEQVLASIYGSARGGEVSILLQATPGDPGAREQNVTYALPVEDASLELGQGFHGSFSHDDEENRYAIDLVAPIGTPVLAARAGIVMQTQADFERGGADREHYSARVNFIRILHDDGTMALYAHLMEGGVMVRQGQRVGLGQLIGYSGNSGFTTGPHLHFALQVNRGMRLVSIPFRMVGPQGFLPLGR
jgi:murein DD-endopeptidase MepM/ murein hydrolase activator NlpD